MKDTILMGIPINKAQLKQMGLTDYVPMPGSTQCDCIVCNQAMWLGARQTEMHKMHPEMLCVCGCCYIMSGQANPENVHSLGGRSGEYHFPDGRVMGGK